jgi:hypothetical protein
MGCFCCESVYNVGCVPACEGNFIDIGIEAQESNEGVFTMVFNFDGIEVSTSATIAKGDPIRFPFDSNCMNESYTYTAQIYQADGTLLPLTYDEVTYDCIKFQTIIQIVC